VTVTEPTSPRRPPQVLLRTVIPDKPFGGPPCESIDCPKIGPRHDGGAEDDRTIVTTMTMASMMTALPFSVRGRCASYFTLARSRAVVSMNRTSRPTRTLIGSSHSEDARCAGRHSGRVWCHLGTTYNNPKKESAWDQPLIDNDTPSSRVPTTKKQSVTATRFCAPQGGTGVTIE
jgi:hypothetical protein